MLFTGRLTIFIYVRDIRRGIFHRISNEMNSSLMKLAPHHLFATMTVCCLWLTAAGVFGQPESSLVYPGNDGKLVYEKHANTAESNADNLMIDYSHCGFMGGGVAIPDVPVKVTLYPQFGDDQQRIQEAIDYVSGLEPDAQGYRGAVLLKAGSYELGNELLSQSDALQIRKSGVVLRGEGQGSDGTILTSSFEVKHQMIATRPERPSAGQSHHTRISDPYVGSGVHGFHVEDASGYAVGDTIFVRFTPNQTWLDETYANAYMGDGDIDWDTDTYTLNYERIITHVEDDSIAIHSPVILPMQEKYGGGAIVKLTYPEPRLNRVGVENMRLVGTGITPSCQADNPNRLKTAVHFSYTENSWIRSITVLHTSNSLFKMWDSHHNTIEDCASVEPLGPKRAGYRYTFYFDAASSHNFCQRTYTDDGRHDYVLGPRIPGPNVFLDGVSQRGGTQGPHQRWATGTLFDNLKLESMIALEHRNGSGSGHSWAGVQSTLWNTESPSIICDAPAGHLNYAIGNTGNEAQSWYVDNTQAGVYRGYYDSHGTHVATRSLYLKQLEDRLGISAVENIAISEQLEGTIYNMLQSWKGEGAITEYLADHLASPVDLSLSDLETEEGSQFIEIQWSDPVPDETGFILERSDDGGATYTEIATLPANTVSYQDTDISQTSYHYRLKAVNETLSSAYVYLFVDMTAEALYANVTFHVNMRDITDRYEGGDVWMVNQADGARHEMDDPDADSIFEVTRTYMVGKNLVYSFAYQDGADSASNITIEEIDGMCVNADGYRHLTVPDEDMQLDPFLFGSCNVALPPGVDITDLEGTIIMGSNEDEEWIDAESGSGSPPGETVEMLFDNNVETKYLVRDVYSWVEIKTNRFTKLNGYTITSANDAPSRDPRDWRLRAWNRETERWDVLHSVTDNPVWERRFMTRVWNIDNESWYDRYRLYITGINGDTQGLMQMAELQLFGEVGEYTAMELAALPDVSVYPNPASGHLYIEWPEQTGSFTVEFFDMTGKQVYSGHREAANGSPVRVSLSSLKPGMYVIKLVGGGSCHAARVVVGNR